MVFVQGKNIPSVKSANNGPLADPSNEVPIDTMVPLIVSVRNAIASTRHPRPTAV